MNHIRLNLPHSWDSLTVPQLEAVARLFITEARHYTLTGQYDRTRLLVSCFFELSGLRVTSLALSDEAPATPAEAILGRGTTPAPEAVHGRGSEEEPLPPLATPSTPPDHTYYTCEYRDLTLRNRCQTVNGRVVPIRIYLNEIMSLAIGDISEKDITRYLKKLDHYHARLAKGKAADEPEPPEPQGPLSWLLKPCTLTLFPYPELTLPDPHHDEGTKERWLNPDTLQPEVRTVPPTVTLAGPAEMMQDFSWQQYRFAGDFVSYLAQLENALLREQKKAVNNSQLTINNAPAAAPVSEGSPRGLTPRVANLQQQVQEARAQWLATLFSRPVLHQDERTRQLTYSPTFLPSQYSDNAYLFMDFPEEQFQAISFWWQGMMHHLAQQFPKVFKSAKVSLGGSDDPFTLYTRSTTTMIKYAATNEDQVNHTTYTIILQHMQDMAEENERIEAMKKG